MTEQRRGMRRALALLTVAAIAGALASWGWLLRFDSIDEQDHADLELFLDASTSGWVTATEQFFAVAESTAEAVGALAADTDGVDERLSLLLESVAAEPTLDAAFVGYPNGEFVFAARSDEPPGGFRTRAITGTGDERVVALQWIDPDRTVVRSELDADDAYDPRERPWYITDSALNDVAWTDPYVFASSQLPGITHSRAVRDPAGGIELVAGVDIRLTELSSFLDELRPGPNGEALVIDRRGGIIAASPLTGAELDAVTGDPSLLDPLDRSTELLDLIARLDLDDDRLSIQVNDGTRTTVIRELAAGTDWFIAVRALDTDFVGGANQRVRRLVETIAVGVGAGLVALLLAWSLLRYRDGLREHATHDRLTGLLSRRGIEEEVDSALRSAKPLALGIIDLDKFKPINDAHGHLVGDLVLEAVAARISSFAQREGAVAGRLGGDEFVVFGDPHIAWADLTATLAEDVSVEGLDEPVHPGASIGVTVTDGTGDATLLDLLAEADHALFEAKRAGGNCHRRWQRGEPLV